MDLLKIGAFIAKCRKNKNLTQMQLAEKLNITDRAVSKWETGKALPDSSIMLELCSILEINVQDLLSGEVVSMNNLNEKTEQLLLEITKQKEEADRRLLAVEVVLGVITIAILLCLCIIAAYVEMEDWLRITLICAGFIPLAIAIPFMLKIEQVAGYYECKKCGHKYVPTFKAINLAPHMCRTRYMRCPNCNKKSWQKKVISKD
ncbi:MAG: helix-turn-helix transcriptional regulator [Clostridia bacterium]|nr:helix-turn-helix transcriptional regulator [Clostridia bacterium]